MFDQVLIPNRGEIAVRIVKACRELGAKTVLAASSFDAQESLASRLADRVVRIGGPRPAESYLNLPAILATASACGVDAVHPGYGFLSEDSRLAAGCRELGVTFVGPSADVLDNVGDKTRAREIAVAAGVPISPGRSLPAHVDAKLAQELERELGYPMLIKAVHGGGGRGMRLVHSPDQLAEAVAAAANEATAAFGDPALYVERFVARARHVEVQILGIGGGEVLVLGDRDCSVQRRHQKLIEEAPAPTLSPVLRQDLRDSARRIGQLLAYESAGTVEFVVDDATGEYFFLEVNARLQVEHPVTEMVTSVDIVRSQLEIAAGDELEAAVCDEPLELGCALECRINAEAPERNFQPSPGRITSWRPPPARGVRIDSHCYSGYVVPPFYDSLLAKVIAFGTTRDEAISSMRDALEHFDIGGIDTTAAWSAEMVGRPEFREATVHTRWVDERL